MATSIPPRSGPGTGRFRRRYNVICEINVTPMVDIMLVLLIVFVVTAPLMTVGVPVDLPKTEAAQLNSQDEPPVVTIAANGQAFLQETPLDMPALIGRLTSVTSTKPDTKIFVRGDQAISYGKVMEVMGAISSAGLRHVALMAEMPSPKKVRG